MKVLSQFTVLFGAVRELWIVFGVKLGGILAYSVLNSTLVLWLSADLGYKDAQAGYIVAAWSTVMTLFTVLVGSLTDAIGLRKTILIGLYLCVGARAVMTFTTAPLLIFAAGLLPLAFGEALGGPVLVAGVRRFSTTAQRSMAFSVFYALMNAGFFIAAIIFDYVRKNLGEPNGSFSIPGVGIQLTTYRTLFLISLIVEILLLPLVHLWMRNGVEATDEGVKIVPEAVRERGTGLGFWTSMWKTFKQTIRDTVVIFTGLWQQSGFYKFLAFLSLAAMVRLVMFHMYYTYPKFGIRELGLGAPVGKLWAINSIIIILLVPIIGALTQRMAAYRMVMIGSTIAAASVYIMSLPPSWFIGLADTGMARFLAVWYLKVAGSLHPYYVMIALFVIVFSVGEAFYSPRLYEYAAAVAPKGQEASYMSISYLPFFVAKLCVGMFSGVLLQNFCPEVGPRNSAMLWLIIALTTTIAPVGLLVLRRWIQVPEAGRS